MKIAVMLAYVSYLENSPTDDSEILRTCQKYSYIGPYFA